MLNDMDVIFLNVAMYIRSRRYGTSTRRTRIKIMNVPQKLIVRTHLMHKKAFRAIKIQQNDAYKSVILPYRYEKWRQH